MNLVEVTKTCKVDCEQDHAMVFQARGMLSMRIMPGGKDVYLTDGDDGVILPRFCHGCGEVATYHYHFISKV